MAREHVVPIENDPFKTSSALAETYTQNLWLHRKRVEIGNREDFACIRLVLRLSHGLVGCQQPSLTAGYLPGHLDRADWKDPFLSSPAEQGPTARRFPPHILNQFVMAVSMLTTTLFDCHRNPFLCPYVWLSAARRPWV
ncbi:hypothetical protein Ddc_08502 [Ditylenchus destructor]|nr:hypothetical protein Ddc_08502 [Ditylenchus destructor]